MPAPKYGEMLQFFPEMIEDFELFKMKALLGGGYGPRYDIRKVRGYWSWRKHSELSVEGDLRASSERATFWVKDDGSYRIQQGDYTEVNQEIFVVMDEDNFVREGGFTRVLMRELAGPTDQQVVNTKVDEVVINDY